MDLVVGNVIRYITHRIRRRLEDVKPSRDPQPCLPHFRRIDCSWYDDAVEQAHLRLDGDRLGCPEGLPNPAHIIMFGASVVAYDAA